MGLSGMSKFNKESKRKIPSTLVRGDSEVPTPPKRTNQTFSISSKVASNSGDLKGHYVSDEIISTQSLEQAAADLMPTQSLMGGKSGKKVLPVANQVKNYIFKGFRRGLGHSLYNYLSIDLLH